MANLVAIQSAAARLGVTKRTLQARAAKGTIPAQRGARNGRDIWLLPESWVREEMARKGLISAQGNQAEPEPLKDEAYARRLLVSAWADWEKKNRRTGESKRQAMVRFCEKFNSLELPGTKEILPYIQSISPASLYRWSKNKVEVRAKAVPVKQVDEGLLTGYSRPFKTTLNSDQQAFILSLWLHQGQPGARTVWRYLASHEVGQEVSYSTVYRYLKNFARHNRGVVTLARQGNKAYDDQVGGYLERDWNQLNPDNLWIADGHTLDVMLRHPDGKARTATLLKFMDGAARYVTGFALHWTESTDTVLQALAYGLVFSGTPREVLFDNGRAFKNKRFMGQEMNNVRIAGVADDLAIRLHWATAYNAKAKPVERYFRTLKDSYSRMLPTFKGGNVVEKPEQLAEVVKDLDQVPTIPAIYNLLLRWIEWYHHQPHDGLNGQTPHEVYHSVPHRTHQVDQVRHLMRPAFAQQMKRNGVRVWGNWYYSEEHVSRYVGNGEKYVVRLNDWDLSQVDVYTQSGQYLFSAQRQDKMHPLAVNTEEGRALLKAGMSQVRRAKAKDRKALKALNKRLESVDYGELLPEPAAIEQLKEREKFGLEAPKPLPLPGRESTGGLTGLFDE